MTTTRHALLLAALAAVLAPLPASPAALPACGIVPIGCEAWIAIYDGGKEDYKPDVVASPDGRRVFVHSFRASPTGPVVAVVNAYDAVTSASLWSISYADGSGPEPQDMAVSPDGRQVHVTGSGYAGRTTRMFLLTLDASTGAIQWEAHWGIGTEGQDIWNDGETVYAVGAVQNDYAVVAYEAKTGIEKWASYYDARGGFNLGWRGWSYDVAFEVAHAGQNLYVTGVSAAPDGLLEYATLALDAATGAQLWVARNHGTDAEGKPFPSEAYAVKTSKDGSLVYVLGSDGIKVLDARTGEAVPSWIGHEDVVRCRAYFPMLREECQLAPTPDGEALIVLSQTDLAAYDARTGALVWHEVLHIGPDSTWSPPRTMVLSPDGAGVYVASGGGREKHATDGWGLINYVYETRAFDARNGTLLWRVTTKGNANAAYAIDVSPDGGRVFVTGEQGRQNPTNILTVAYDTNLTTFPKLPL